MRPNLVRIHPITIRESDLDLDCINIEVEAV